MTESVAVAEMKGLAALGISDHIHYLTGKRANEYIETIRRWKKETDTVLLAGVEANAQPGGSDVPEHMRRRLDYVIASVHEVVGTPKEYLSLVRDALLDRRVDVIGHFGVSFKHVGWPSWDDLMDIVLTAEEEGKAFEISSSYRVPDIDFVRECVKRGVKLSFGSDAHRPDRVGDVGWCRKLFLKAGGNEEDLFLMGLL